MGFKLRPYIINVIPNSYMVSNHEINFVILYPIDDIDLTDLHKFVISRLKFIKNTTIILIFAFVYQQIYIRVRNYNNSIVQ